MTSGTGKFSGKDKLGRPIVVVTGLGVVTSLGAGKVDNWAKLTAGVSGISAITRFGTDGMRTRIAGTIDFLGPQTSTAALAETFADLAAKEAIAESGLGTAGNFPGPLFVAVPPIEVEWPQRIEVSNVAGANDQVTYTDLLRVSNQFPAYHDRFMFGSVADHIADKFGTQGSPISLSTACASGASAVQLGVEAIRRGETDAALCIGTDGSINPEAMIRFSLLSALSTNNDNPALASKPFSKNRDGFIMAEGAGALVLESYESAKARGAKIIGVLEGCGEMAELFPPHPFEPGRQTDHRLHRQRHQGRRSIARRHRLRQCPRHQHAGKRQDGISRRLDRLRRAHEERTDFVEQVDDRPHAVGRRCDRSGIFHSHAAPPTYSPDHQLH